jgi:hydroxymethylglutaryl-CoA lyase
MENKIPQKLRIVDVTGRDGFQNIKQEIPTAVKKKILSGLAAAGVKKMEATSFVSPKAIPQLADAPDIIAYMQATHPEVELAALIPNLKGAQLAFASGVREVTYIISASLEHNLANINRTQQQSLHDLESIAKT